MNERIKELAIKCATNLDWDNPSVDPTEFCYNKQALEKFAELIVQECMACSAWVGRVNKTAIEPVHTAHAINQRIKQHFGVEE